MSARRLIEFVAWLKAIDDGYDGYVEPDIGPIVPIGNAL